MNTDGIMNSNIFVIGKSSLDVSPLPRANINYVSINVGKGHGLETFIGNKKDQKSFLESQNLRQQKKIKNLFLALQSLQQKRSKIFFGIAKLAITKKDQKSFLALKSCNTRRHLPLRRQYATM